jgi:hypothetical protein
MKKRGFARVLVSAVLFGFLATGVTAPGIAWATSPEAGGGVTGTATSVLYEQSRNEATQIAMVRNALTNWYVDRYMAWLNAGMPTSGASALPTNWPALSTTGLAGYLPSNFDFAGYSYSPSNPVYSGDASVLKTSSRASMVVQFLPGASVSGSSVLTPVQRPENAMLMQMMMPKSGGTFSGPVTAAQGLTVQNGLSANSLALSNGGTITGGATTVTVNDSGLTLNNKALSTGGGAINTGAGNITTTGQLAGGTLAVSGAITANQGLYGPGTMGTTVPIWRHSATYPGYGIYYTEAATDSILFTPNGNTTTPAFTVSGNGNVTATGTATAPTVQTNTLTSGNASISVGKNLALGSNNATTSGTITAGTLTATGNVNGVTFSGTNLTSTNASVNVQKGLALNSNNVSGVGTLTAGTVNTSNLTMSGTLSAGGVDVGAAGLIRAGGNYYNCLSYRMNGTPTNGFKIVTNIPYTNGTQMPTLRFEGYSYGDSGTMDITLVWYVYNGNFCNYKASSGGSWTPPISLINEGGKVAIILNAKPYYARFTISAYAYGLSETKDWFTGWQVLDDVSGTTNKVDVAYVNRTGTLSATTLTGDTINAGSAGTGTVNAGLLTSGNAYVGMGKDLAMNDKVLRLRTGGDTYHLIKYGTVGGVSDSVGVVVNGNFVVAKGPLGTETAKMTLNGTSGNLTVTGQVSGAGLRSTNGLTVTAGDVALTAASAKLNTKDIVTANGGVWDLSILGNAATADNADWATGATTANDATTFNGSSKGDFVLARGNDAADWNTIQAPGIYHVEHGSWTGLSNVPASAYTYGTLVVYANPPAAAGAKVVQTYYQYTNGTPWTRSYGTTSGWTAWTQILTDATHGVAGDPHTQYVKKAGDSMTGDLDVTKNNPWLTLDSSSGGADGVEQAAGISVGESGKKGSAALHLTYTGDGYGHIGMGTVSGTTSLPAYEAMRLYYTNNTVRFMSTPNVSGSNLWHAGNDGSGSGMDADLLDGQNAASFASSSHTHSQYTVKGKYDYSVSAGDLRSLKPVDVSDSTRDVIFHFGSLTANGGTPWCDIITLSTYGDATGGGINQIMARKDTGDLYHSYAPWGAAGWSWQRKVWDEGNDGAASGLDADLLDGKQGADHMANRGTVASTAIDTATENGFYQVGYTGARRSLLTWNAGGSVGPLQIEAHYNGALRFRNKTDSTTWTAWRNIWNSSNDGAGSGLDADLLDGRDSSTYANSSAFQGTDTGGATIRSNATVGFLTTTGAAQGVNMGKLLVSNSYSDVSQIPTGNSAYIKNDLKVGGALSGTKFTGNVSADVISEKTTGAGVTMDSLLKAAKGIDILNAQLLQMRNGSGTVGLKLTSDGTITGVTEVRYSDAIAAYQILSSGVVNFNQKPTWNSYELINAAGGQSIAGNLSLTNNGIMAAKSFLQDGKNVVTTDMLANYVLNGSSPTFSGMTISGGANTLMQYSDALGGLNISGSPLYVNGQKVATTANLNGVLALGGDGTLRTLDGDGNMSASEVSLAALTVGSGADTARLTSSGNRLYSNSKKVLTEEDADELGGGGGTSITIGTVSYDSYYDYYTTRVQEIAGGSATPYRMMPMSNLPMGFNSVQNTVMGGIIQTTDFTLNASDTIFLGQPNLTIVASGTVTINGKIMGAGVGDGTSGASGGGAGGCDGTAQALNGNPVFFSFYDSGTANLAGGIVNSTQSNAGTFGNAPTAAQKTAVLKNLSKLLPGGGSSGGRGNRANSRGDIVYGYRDGYTSNNFVYHCLPLMDDQTFPPPGQSAATGTLGAGTISASSGTGPDTFSEDAYMGTYSLYNVSRWGVPKNWAYNLPGADDSQHTSTFTTGSIFPLIGQNPWGFNVEAGSQPATSSYLGGWTFANVQNYPVAGKEYQVPGPGHGGGGVVILAKKIVLNGTIDVRGSSSVGTYNFNMYSGAGGGGSVILAAEEFEGTYGANIKVNGGKQRHNRAWQNWCIGGDGWWARVDLVNETVDMH